MLDKLPLLPRWSVELPDLFKVGTLFFDTRPHCGRQAQKQARKNWRGRYYQKKKKNNDLFDVLIFGLFLFQPLLQLRSLFVGLHKKYNDINEHKRSKTILEWRMAVSS